MKPLSTSRGPTLVWLRQDLRLDDNPALLAAAERGPVVPVFVWSPEEEGGWAPASASRWWLHQSLTALDASLRPLTSRLIVRKGPALATLKDLLRESGADAVFWNRRYEPAVIQRDSAVKAELKRVGATVESFNSALLWEPWEVQTQQGRPFQVYTPFWKACSSQEPPAPRTAPRQLLAPQHWPESVPLEALGLEPTIDWAGGMRAAWTPGEKGASVRLERFLKRAADYAERRDRPDLEGTSALSPHLHFGEISPRRVWHTVRPRNSEVYLKELAWREFAHHLLYHFPKTTDAPLRAEFAKFPWKRDAKALRAWQKGRTGYPIVDAGMRQLWATGWMHNRVRMIVASFLIKDLLIDWREGAKWFWDTLVDADLGSNTLGWQWTAGCGADAAPYFRIFNPVSQGEKFDPKGDYVRQWVPELAQLPAEVIQRPWEASEKVDYPPPLVDHAEARKRALEALEKVKQAKES